MTDTAILRAAGIDCVPFEPYVLAGDKDEVSPSASRAIVRRFLDRVADGIEFDSIFLASILNSVPFRQDREHIVALVASLCSPHTKAFACSASTTARTHLLAAGRRNYNKVDAGKAAFSLGYEPNIVLGDFSKLPKAQKYHTVSEWRDLWATAFGKVRADSGPSTLVTAICQEAAVDHDAIQAAIEFEFDLPYPDGSRMGLVDEAKAAWRSRSEKLTATSL